MLAIALALGAAASWGTGDFLGGASTKRLPILTVSSVSQLAGLLFTVVVVLAIGRAPADGTALLFGLAAGACGVVGLTALYAGLGIGPMGIVAPITALSSVVPVLVGLARGERPEAIQLAGIVLAIVGVVLAARERDAEGAKAAPRAVGLAVVAAVMIGVLLVLLDEGARRDPAWATLMVRLGSVVLVGAAVAVRRPSFSMGRRDLATLGLVGVLDNGANLLFAAASATGELLSVIAVLASLYPVTTVLLARVVLRERLTRVQDAGIVLAFAGVALIGLG